MSFLWGLIVGINLAGDHNSHSITLHFPDYAGLVLLGVFLLFVCIACVLAYLDSKISSHHW